jgi:hypothetical protein
MTMQATELYKLRAEDFARRWENHRHAELQTNFQVYAGYAAIAVAYWRLHEAYPSVCYGAAVLTIALYWVTLYLFVRIQERLHYNYEMMRAYLTQLHVAIGTPELPTPPGVREPSHRRWYQFLAQTILTLLTAIALVTFELSARPNWPAWRWGVGSLVAALVVLAFLTWFIVPWRDIRPSLKAAGGADIAR